MSTDPVQSILEQIRLLPREQRVVLADEVDRLTWRDRVEELVSGIEPDGSGATRLSDDEMDALVREVRSETPLYERYWTRRQQSAP